MLEVIIVMLLAAALLVASFIVARFWIGASEKSFAIYVMFGLILFSFVAIYANVATAAVAVGIYAIGATLGVLRFLWFLKQEPMNLGRNPDHVRA